MAIYVRVSPGGGQIPAWCPEDRPTPAAGSWCRDGGGDTCAGGPSTVRGTDGRVGGHLALATLRGHRTPPRHLCLKLMWEAALPAGPPSLVSSLSFPPTVSPEKALSSARVPPTSLKTAQLTGKSVTCLPRCPGGAFPGSTQGLCAAGRQPVGPHGDPRKRGAPLELTAGGNWWKAGWRGL